MSIYLGNLDVSKIEERCGIRLTPEDKTALSSCWKRKVSDVEVREWHCFDVPFCIVCGDMGTAIRVYHILNKYEEQIQELMDTISGINLPKRDFIIPDRVYLEKAELIIRKHFEDIAEEIKKLSLKKEFLVGEKKEMWCDFDE